MLPRSTRKINLFLQASRPIVNDVTRDPLFYNPNALTSCISEWEGERERERSPCMIRDLRSLRFKPVRLGEAEMEKTKTKWAKLQSLPIAANCYLHSYSRFKTHSNPFRASTWKICCQRTRSHRATFRANNHPKKTRGGRATANLQNSANRFLRE